MPHTQTLGEQGEVDAAQGATAEAERLKGQRSAYESGAQARAWQRTGRNLNQQVGPGAGRALDADRWAAQGGSAS